MNPKERKSEKLSKRDNQKKEKRKRETEHDS